MNASAFVKVSKAEFWDFVQAQAEGKFEYERGRIVQQMTGGTHAHAILIQRFTFALMRDLDPSANTVTSQSRGVDTPVTIRYPDAVVERVGSDAKSLATSAPLVLVEVLSPNTEKLDLNVKPQEYTSLPSLLAYIVASQDRPECLVWQRAADGGFADDPARIAGPGAQIVVEGLGLRLELDEIYRGI